MCGGCEGEERGVGGQECEPPCSKRQYVSTQVWTQQPTHKHTNMTIYGQKNDVYIEYSPWKQKTLICADDG